MNDSSVPCDLCEKIIKRFSSFPLIDGGIIVICSNCKKILDAIDLERVLMQKKLREGKTAMENNSAQDK